MSAFTGPLSITALDEDCRTWRLEQDLVYEVGRLGSGRIITVEAGTVSDGASIPRLIQPFLPLWGRWSRGAFVHDTLYDRLIAGQPHPEAPTRARADAIFLEAMLVSGVPRLTAYAIWTFVRIFGASHAHPIPLAA